MADIEEFFTPEILVQPHPFYESTRPARPVFKTVMPGQNLEVFIVTSYALVRQVLDDHATWSSDVMTIMLGAGRHDEAVAQMDEGTGDGPLLLNMDEPAHGRYRALFNPIFSPRQVAVLTPKIAEIMDRLIDSVIERGTCDFIEDIAVPFPLYVLLDMLGLDRALYPEIRRWTDAIARRGGQQETGETHIATMREIEEFNRFFRAELAARRAAPRDDLITELLAARIDGVAPLTERELARSLMELSIAGNETTRNTMVGGLGILLRDPATLNALRQDLKQIPAAVEELLRLFSPVTGTWRIATRDVTLGGVEIRAGSAVMVRIESANRDPAQFPDPDRIDLARRNRNTHLTFSQGVHYCVGNMLARRELALALEKILTRFDNLELIEETSDLTPPPSVMLRANNAMNLRFTPGQRSLS